MDGTSSRLAAAQRRYRQLQHLRGADVGHLAEHLSLCSRSRSPMHALRNGASLVRGFVAPRLVTTVFFVALMALI